MPRPSLFALCLLATLTQAAEPLPLGVQVQPPEPVAGEPGRLIFSRDTNAPNACDVELYVNQEVAATLGPGERTALDLPSGTVSLAVAISASGYCGGQGPGPSQSILLGPGETRQYAIMVKPGQVFLAPLLN